MENKETSFNYTYSAAEQTEIESIRKKYLPQAESKLEQLRKLHNSATQKAQSWAIALGVIGALILGSGMSLIMTDLASILGMAAQLALVIGVAAGLAGLVLVALAYPVYQLVLRNQRNRIAPLILQLSDELLQ